MSKVPRSVQYRFLSREHVGSDDASLEQLLRRALSARRDGDEIGRKARARVADLEQSGQLTLWNGLQGLDKGGALAGELVLYKQGFDVPAIEERLDQDDNRFNLVRFQTDGKSKPVEGTLYFAIIGDHLGVIQSNAVNTRWLERYFTWILKDITTIIDGESVIALHSRIAFDAAELAKSGPARSMSIHAADDTQPAKVDVNGGIDVNGDAFADIVGFGFAAKRDFRTKAKGKGNKVIEILSLLGIGEDAIESIQSDVPPGGRLEGDFNVYIKHNNRRQAISIGTMNHTLRHLDPDDIEIEQKGSRLRKKAQTLSQPVRITEGPLGLDPNEAIEQIIEVLYRWNTNGVVNLGPRE